MPSLKKRLRLGRHDVGDTIGAGVIGSDRLQWISADHIPVVEVEGAAVGPLPRAAVAWTVQANPSACREVKVFRGKC